MKNKRLWLSVTLTVLVVVCAMLILSRINETRSNVPFLQFVIVHCL